MARNTPVLAMLAMLLFLAGCGVEGTAVPAEIDVRTLDVGAYPVDKFHHDQDSRGAGALVEGMRMSEAVTTGPPIDSTLSVGLRGEVVNDAEFAEEEYLAGYSADVLRTRNMIVGYASISSDTPAAEGAYLPDPPGTGVISLVMRFPSESDAKLAARELEDVDFAHAADQNKRLGLSEYPDAYIHWRPGIADIGTFMAYRQFVISLLIQRPRADSADLLDWVRKTLDAQVALLDTFQPTPTEKIDDLPIDPDGVLDRVLTAHRGSRAPDPASFGVYGPSFYTHNAFDQTLVRKLLADNGADRIGIDDSAAIIRTRDTGTAADLITGIANNLGSAFDPIKGPGSVPGVKCFHRTGGGSSDAAYRCYVPYRRYAAIVSAETEDDVKQKVAAQYALLANSM
ncbi:DUF7373 family lipoprotein [Nocardia huaxiensis]|uniref:Uncharacterized protein n=1 Tax=Nocardia huaxiensis TaxID=2755382 RepID=A0A7D6V521_9NOCA|nr:hypothetical protein [Nocardia huaxiensis]QLY27701.1 hypothetical protein H0264_19740 [Nocardia huaxiensis]UFS98910.1 hypothetical protein LPY97_13960 [Nocardia huaxiensis]